MTPSADGTFSRRTLLALSGAVGAGFAAQLLFGCGTGASSTANATTSNLNPQPTPSGTIGNGTAMVTSVSAGTITPGFCALSYEKDALWRRTLSTDNSPLVALLKLLNASSLFRVGGNSADHCNFSPSGAGKTSGRIAPSDMDAFAAFLRATNSSVIYGINLKGATSSPPSQTAALAVAEVNYAVTAFGSSLNSIEIGNEPDLYPATTGGTITFSQYRALWEPIATAIRTAQPTLALAGPVDASLATVGDFTVPFAAAESKFGLSLLTQHRYVGDAAKTTSTDANLLSDATDTYANQQMQAVSGAATSIHAHWRMAETGTYYDSAAGTQAKDFASALWLIDYLFENAANGSTGINLHSGSTFSFSPINDNNATTVTAVNAVFYGALLFSLAGSGTVLNTNVSTSTAATAHTIQVDSKHYSTIIVNKDPAGSTNLRMVLTLPDRIATATAKVLTASALSAQTGMTLQGGVVGLDGSYSPASDYTLSPSGTTVTCYVPFSSAVLIQIVLA